MKKLKGDYLVWIAIIVSLIAIIVCIINFNKIEDWVDNTEEKQKTESILDRFMSGY